MAKRPNILIFMPDQLRADAVGAFASPVASTPNIDALAARGMAFDQAFVNHPVCSPSRVTMMTGWYPHVRGHRTLTHLVQAHEPNLLAYLKESGYYVALAGARGDVFANGVTEASTHFCGWTVKPERTQMGMGPTQPEGSPLYHAFYHGDRGPRIWLDFDEAVTRTALEFLEAPPSEPWLLWMPMIFPHLPFEAETPFLDRHDPARMPAPLPAAIGKPAFHEAIRSAAHLDQVTLDQWQQIARVYHAMTSRVDAQLGRVLAALDAGGLTDDTLVVFLTDHGEYLGDFGLVEKWPAGLEPCLTRNPMIIAGPGVAEGRRCDALVEMVDLLPTCLDWAVAEARHTHFGHSLGPLLADPASAWPRTAAFTEGGFNPADAHLFEESGGEYALKSALQRARPRLVGKAVAMRTLDWTYVHRLHEDDELYDRRTDPHEQHNLLVAATPAHRDRASAMRSGLLDWHMATSDVIPWTRDARFPRTPNGPHEARN